jgi:hypothetical protein
MHSFSSFVQDISQAFGVSAMPTFILLKSGNPVGQMQGANKEGLEQITQDALAGGGGGGGGGGEAAGGGAAGAVEDDSGVDGQVRRRSHRTGVERGMSFASCTLCSLCCAINQTPPHHQPWPTLF